jgi:septal ring-binding cell division protein DamX
VCYKVARPAIKSLTNSASKKMTVKWAKNAKANGYQIQYSLKSNFSGAKKWDSKKNSIVSKVFGSLTKGKKYYVRMRTYKKVGSKYYYSTWSATKTVVIKK